MVTDTIMPPPRTMMEVFKNLPEGTLAQLIENNLIMAPAPLTKHQLLVLEIASELFGFTKKKKLGKVFTAPYDVFLDRKNAYQPDICFISNENKQFIKPKGFYGVPDLVIEVLSPTTAKYDLEEKKDVYERCGVVEYWLVEPSTNATTGYALENGEYKLIFEGIAAIDSPLLEWKLEWEVE